MYAMVEVSYHDTVKGIMKTNDGNTIILRILFPKGRRIFIGVDSPWWAGHGRAERVTSWKCWKGPE